MIADPLPLLSPPAAYEAQAAALLAAFRAGDPAAAAVIHRHHPRFVDPAVPWRPRELAAGELASAGLDLDAARLAVARGYSFRDWPALTAHVVATIDPGSPVHGFERAAEAVITGDDAALDRLLAADPTLARARSSRVTDHDPPVHRATLLHYLAANGVEDHRQRSAPGAVAIAARLLAAGAEPDALAGMYGGEYATLSMLASSGPPAEAGVQVPLIHALLDAGADVDGVGSARWGSNVRSALAFGCVAAAEALVARGARIATVAIAAGLGREDDVARMLPAAGADDRHAALALAAQLGHAAIVGALLDAGEDPDRYNPDGLHAHATPLHHAALGGHAAVVRLMIARGARLDLGDRLWRATPQGWARHAGHADLARLLAEAEAEADRSRPQ